MKKAVNVKQKQPQKSINYQFYMTRNQDKILLTERGIIIK